MKKFETDNICCSCPFSMGPPRYRRWEDWSDQLCTRPGSYQLFSYLLQYFPGVDVRLVGCRTQLKKSQTTIKDVLAFGPSLRGPGARGGWTMWK